MKEKLLLLLIFIIALAWRIIAVNNLPLQYQTIGADAKGYHDLAVNMLTGKGFISNETGLPTSLRPPLYPLFLSFIYLLFGVNYFVVRIIQCIIGALLCVIVYFIAKIIFDERIALISALAMAFYQPYILYVYYGGPGFILSENLFTFLFALTILFLIKGLYAKKSYLKNILLSGFFLGLSALTRPDIAFFPVFLFILLFFYFKDKLKMLLAAKKLLLFSVVFILTIAPWSLRNFFVYKAFVPLSTHGGYVFWSGNNLSSRGSMATDIEPHGVEVPGVIPMKTEAQSSNLYFREGLKFLLNNYRVVPKLFSKKFIITWSLFNDFNKYNIWYGVVLVFSLFGIYRVFILKLNNNIGSYLLLLIFLYFSFIAIIFLGEPRFRFPTEPFLIIFGSAGIATVGRIFKTKFLSLGLICLILATNAFFYIYSDSILNFIRFFSRRMGLSW